MSLASVSVKKGVKINKGDVVGTVGQSDPDLPPRLHFEMRREATASRWTRWSG
jgi:murein DD-endopeptidase MepM/ murein hydrolase activator NlpD